MTRLLTLALLLLTVQARAANHYVLPAGSGSKSGNDWSNAFQGIPATQVRGDTYYIGGGTGYGFTIFNQADVGTAYIFFKKATVADHGTATGWLDTYGTSPAVWHNNGQCWEIRTDYLDFDGVTGDKTHGDLNYGIVATDSESGPPGQRAVIICYSGQHALGIRLHHLEVSGLGPDQVDCQHQVAGLLCNASQGLSDSWFVEYCYIHDVANWSSLALTPNVTLAHCWFKNAGSSCFSNHGNGINFAGDNMAIYFCVLENMLGGANTTYIEPQGSANHAASNSQIYGNLFIATDPTENTTQWANFSAVASNYSTGNRFYNNTSYGLHGPIGDSYNSLGGRVPISGADNRVQNNLWINCANSDGCPDANVLGDNVTFGITSGADFGDLPWTGAFANPATLDFHLTANTPNGVSLVSPWNIDMDGNTRVIGAWSIGAYQYTGSLPPPPQPQLSFSLSSYACNETDGSVTLTVTKTGTGSASVNYSTSAGSATPGNDYSTVSGTLSFLTTDAQKTFSIPILDSHTFQAQTRSFTATLSGPVNATLNLSQAQVVITMNSQAPVISLAFTTNAVAIAEPTVSTVLQNIVGARSGSSVGAVTAHWATHASTALPGHDYNTDSGTFSWADGDIGLKTNTVEILASGDTALTNRTFTAVMDSVTGPGAVLGNPTTSTITIVMNQPTPPPLPVIALTGPTFSCSETQGVVLITVQKTGTGAASVVYGTSNGSATAGVDYTATTGTLNFASGDVVKTIAVPIIDEHLLLLQTRSFLVSLSGPGSATLGLSQALVSISMDSTPPTISLQMAQNSASVQQPSGSPSTVDFVATRTGSSVGAVSVNWSAVGQTAQPGHDFTAASGTFSWPNGDAAPRTNQVTLLASGDTATTNRTFLVTLSSPAGNGASLGTPLAEQFVLVMNQPAAPLTAAGSYALTSALYPTMIGAGTLSIPVTHAGSTNVASSVQYATANGSATAGIDYTATSGTLNFAANGTQFVNIPILNSGKFGTQPILFTLTLSNPTAGATLGLSQATVSIQLQQPVTVVSTFQIGGKVVWSVTNVLGTR